LFVTLLQQVQTNSQTDNNPETMAEVEIPKQCKAGVVVNEGPDFKVEVQMVDVPEPGELCRYYSTSGIVLTARKAPMSFCSSSTALACA
jgi:prolyl oligopeptidase PreP (S9A serine peptidase family)